MPEEELISTATFGESKKQVSAGSTPRDSRSYYSSFQSMMDPEEAAATGRVVAAVPDPRKLVHRTLNNNQAAAGDGTLANAITESTRTSFTLAVKECQKRRSESLQQISDCHRPPVSLDLSYNVAACSPRLGGIKSGSILKHCSGALTSPVTPNYRHTGDGLHKGWSSERVPLHQNGNRRQLGGGGAHFAFNHGGTLPSKWEDAERWIFGPATTDIGLKQSAPPTQRRPRSKSGPLGPSGVSYCSSHSPAMNMFHGIHGGVLLAESHFAAGIMAADSSQTDEERHDDTQDAATDVSRVVSRRDMATQMSSDGSPCSSSRRKHSISSAISIVEMHSNNSPRLDIRDVEVDERVKDTVTRWSRKNKSHLSGRGKENVDDWESKTATTHSTAWDVSETAKNISKVRKEEARIAAWEGLQKAKAEAAVKKLEMKLEKKRSSAMDKIMNKLRSAQKKGQEMRRAVLPNQDQQVSDSSNQTFSLRPTRPMSSLSGCFTCHAF